VDSKHAFAICVILKKRDNTTILHLSASMYIQYNFTESGCCLFQVFCQKKGVIYWFSILIHDPKNTECIAVGMKFKVTNVRCRIQSDKTLFVSRRGNRTRYLVFRFLFMFLGRFTPGRSAGSIASAVLRMGSTGVGSSLSFCMVSLLHLTEWLMSRRKQTE
jgi:hypothetical protein